jgi:hypothetical protein
MIRTLKNISQNPRKEGITNNRENQIISCVGFDNNSFTQIPSSGLTNSKYITHRISRSVRWSRNANVTHSKLINNNKFRKNAIYDSLLIAVWFPTTNPIKESIN